VGGRRKHIVLANTENHLKAQKPTQNPSAKTTIPPEKKQKQNKNANKNKHIKAKTI